LAFLELWRRLRRLFDTPNYPSNCRRSRPNLQGEVALVSLLLRDRAFEPAMMEGGNLTPLLGPIFGTGEGAGMAVLYVLCSVGLLLVGIAGQVMLRQQGTALGWDRLH